jgi:hypothetical protein
MVFSAHLDHPKESANDNASGSGALLDIARSVRDLIASGRLPRPRRTLRFLWVPEWYGTQAYIDKHPELAGPALGGRVLANANMDMVGENTELLHSRLILTRTPASLPSAFNDVIANMAAMVDGMNVRTPRGSLAAFNYRVTPYSGGSDHMNFIDRRIPGVMFSHDPDYTHHTSEDTPDKVDPVELERCELIAAAALLYLSDLTAAQAVDLAHLTAAQGGERLGEAARRARVSLLAAQGPARAAAWFEARNAVNQATRWEAEALSSVLWYRDAPAVRSAVEAARRRLRQLGDGVLASLQSEARAAGVTTSDQPRAADLRVPMRLTRGPLDFGLPRSRLSAEDGAWYRDAFPLDGDQRFELVNFIDGRRTVSDIRDALSAEYGPVALATVARYLEDLVRVGVVKWK